jgi:ribokinase
MKAEQEQIKKVLVVGNLAKDIILGSEKYGGCAATIAITLKRLGVDSGVLSVVGRDEFSGEFIEYLENMGIDTKYVYRNIESIPVCEVNSSENLISSSNWIDNGCHDAMDALSIDHQLRFYDFVHLVSSPPILSLHLSEELDNISYEPGPMLIHDEKYFDINVAKKSKFIFLNEEEYDALVSYDRGISKSGYDLPGLIAMIVTLGSRGSKIISSNGTEVLIPPVPLRGNIVDSVGAGDNFKAGFLAGYLMGKSLTESAKFGSLLGSLCVQQKGGILPEETIASVMPVG